MSDRSPSVAVVVAQTDYLVFVDRSDLLLASQKTKLWHVCSKSSGEVLGRIRWWGAWRQYVFEPRPTNRIADFVIFNVGCLDDITTFIREHKSARRVGI